MRLLIWENIIKILCDSIAVMLAFVGAYYFRLFSFSHSLFPFADYMQVAVLMIPIWILFLAWLGRYGLKDQNLKEMGKTIFMASLSASLLFPLLFYFSNDRFFSRGIILLLFIFSVVLLFIISLFFKKYSRWNTRMLVIGANKDAQRIIKNLLHYNAKHVPVAVISPYGSKIKTIENVPIVGKLDALEKITQQFFIDEIFLCEGVEHSENLASFCRNKGLVLKTSLETLGMQNSRIEAQTIGGTVFLTLQQSPLFGWGQFFKRLFDIVISTIGLIIFSPIILWYRNHWKWKVFQKNTDETFLAFHIEKNGVPLFSRWTLLYNVLKKDISMVGPRLFSAQEYSDMFSNMHTGVEQRTLLRSGIFSQSSMQTDPIEIIKTDIRYIQHWSFYKDISIIASELQRQ